MNWGEYMCDKLNTFIVDKESFVYAMEHGYGIINKYDYVEGSDNLLPKGKTYPRIQDDYF